MNPLDKFEGRIRMQSEIFGQPISLDQECHISVVLNIVLYGTEYYARTRVNIYLSTLNFFQFKRQFLFA